MSGPGLSSSWSLPAESKNVTSTEIEKRKKVNSDLKEELVVTKKKETTMIQDMNELKTEVTATQEGFTKFQISLIIPVVAIIIIMSMYFSTIKEQDNFIAPLPGVEVIMSTDIVIHGGQSKNFTLEEYGLIVDCPRDALPTGLYAKINIRLSVSGPYVFPDSGKWRSVTPVYWISSSKELLNPIQLGIRHYVGGKANSSVIKVLTADDSPKNNSYIFKEIPNFTVNESYVFISKSHFSSVALNSLEQPQFSGTLFKEKCPTAKYEVDYIFVVHCTSFSQVIKSILELMTDSSWSVVTVPTPVIFEENSSSIELHLPENNNWDVEGKITPLIYYKKYLTKCDDIHLSMQFSLYWKRNDTTSVIGSLSLPLTGATHPKSITVPLPEISFMDKYEVVILLFGIIIGEIGLLLIGKFYPNRSDDAIGILMSILEAVLFSFVTLFIYMLFPRLSGIELRKWIYGCQ